MSSRRRYSAGHDVNRECRADVGGEWGVAGVGHLTCAICDYGAAMLSALGCVLALRARQTTGRGQMREVAAGSPRWRSRRESSSFTTDAPTWRTATPNIGAARHCRDAIDVATATGSVSQSPSRAIGTRCPRYAAARSCRMMKPHARHPRARSRKRWKITSQSSIAPRRYDRGLAGIPAAPVRKVSELFDDPQVVSNELIAEGRSIRHTAV